MLDFMGVELLLAILKSTIKMCTSEELDTIKHVHSCHAKRCNKKGQGRKLSYPLDIDMDLLQWVLEQRELTNVPASCHAIKVKAMSL